MKKVIVFCSVFVFCFILAFEANAQNRKAVSGAEVTGTFREKASGSQFKIAALGRGKLRIEFEGVYPYKTPRAEVMANTGTAGGTADIAGDSATFTPEEFQECTITLKFLTGGRLKVTQQGTDAQCGFGHNVSATGTYRKISAKKPTFDVN